MKKMLLIMFALAIVAVAASPSMSKSLTPEERGKVLFETVGFADGKVACSACHPNGTGLENVNNRTKFRVAGQMQDSLEDAVNACIKFAAKGKPIPVDSAEMRDIVSYIRSLGK
jgi:cytochrome c